MIDHDGPVAIATRSDIHPPTIDKVKHVAQIQLASAREWSRIARQWPQYNFQQSPAYSLELATRRRASCEFIYIEHPDEEARIVGGASVRIRSARVPGAGLAYISAGPLLARRFSDQNDFLMLQAVIDSLASEYVDRRQLCLRISLPPMDLSVARRIAGVFNARGFRIARAATSYRTLLVDLTRTIQEIRATLSHKWRNQLNAALRNDASIEVTRGADAVARFAPLLEETSRRKGFTTELDAAFYDRVQQTADADDRMVVAFAVKEGTDVAGVVASLLGDTAVYVLGATTIRGMQSKAAYALHWQVMQTARDLGCRWYDLGGINPENNPGVYHFKSGLGGADVVMPGPFEVRPPGIAGLVSTVVGLSYAHLKQWRR